MSSPTSVSSNDSQELTLEFNSPSQVEELYSTLVDRYNESLLQLEILEGVDDDIQELRETKLNEYEFLLMAEAYEAAGEKTVATGMRSQAEECVERIEELQEMLEDIDIKEHHMELYEMEIQKETYEIQMKACEKYLEKGKRKAQMAAKKATIRPISPRRFPKAASPSRLTNDAKVRTPVTPKEAPKRAVLPLPKLTMLPPRNVGK